jgi:hypothetical protein
VDRARLLIEPYTRQPGVRGIYLVGSASRPYRDVISDYDFEVLVDDAIYENTPLSERHRFEIDPGPPRRVDHEFLLRPWSSLSEMKTSTRDLDHAPFQFATILFDPSGETAPALRALAELPSEVRTMRLRVHYLEFLYNASRSKKCFARGDDLNSRMTVNDAVNGLYRFVFVALGFWPPLRHWATQELGEAGVPDEVLSLLRRAVSAPGEADLGRLVEAVHAWMEHLGLDFHKDQSGLREWAFLTEEGTRAFRTWGIR